MINCPISLSKVAWKKKENSVSQSHCVARSSAVMQDLKYLFSGDFSTLLKMWCMDLVIVMKISP